LDEAVTVIAAWPIRIRCATEAAASHIPLTLTKEDITIIVRAACPPRGVARLAVVALLIVDRAGDIILAIAVPHPVPADFLDAGVGASVSGIRHAGSIPHSAGYDLISGQTGALILTATHAYPPVVALFAFLNLRVPAGRTIGAGDDEDAGILEEEVERPEGSHRRFAGTLPLSAHAGIGTPACDEEINVVDARLEPNDSFFSPHGMDAEIAVNDVPIEDDPTTVL
jgi:hypothetical protein